MSLRLYSTLIMSKNVKQEECGDFEFLIQGSFNSLEDLALILGHYSENPPSSWNSFFDTLFRTQNKSARITRKFDTILQIVYYLVHNGQKKTSLHAKLCECVHDTSRSNALIQIMNILGLGIGYDKLERTDTGQTIRTIQLAGNKEYQFPKLLII